MVTVLTLPILCILYRRNYDVKTLSASNVAEDICLVKEGNINMIELDSNIETISNGEIGNNE